MTFLINEPPFVAFCLLVAATVPAWLQGDLAAPGGLVTFGVAVLVAGGLAVLALRARRPEQALRQALAAGGIDYSPGRRPWLRILFAPGAVHRRRTVAEVRNIAYGDAGKQNLLDVYHRPAGAPVFVFMHGGGFRIGSKNREAARCSATSLRGAGWASTPITGSRPPPSGRTTSSTPRR